MKTKPLLQKNGLFSTPSSWESIMTRCESMDNTAEAMVLMMTVWNFAAESAEAELERRSRIKHSAQLVRDVLLPVISKD